MFPWSIPKGATSQINIKQVQLLQHRAKIDFFLKNEKTGELLHPSQISDIALTRHISNRYPECHMYSVVTDIWPKPQDAIEDKYNFQAITSVRTCREELVASIYNTMFHCLKNGETPITEAKFQLGEKTYYTNTELELTIGDIYKQVGSKKYLSTLLNLMVGLPYILITRGIEQEAQRLNETKPARLIYRTKWTSRYQETKTKMTFPVMSGIVANHPPVFISLLGAFLRIASSLSIQPSSLNRMRNANKVTSDALYLLAKAGTSSRELVNVINSANVERAEEIFSKISTDVLLLEDIVVKRESSPFNWYKKSLPLRLSVDLLNKGLVEALKIPVEDIYNIQSENFKRSQGCSGIKSLAESLPEDIRDNLSTLSETEKTV